MSCPICKKVEDQRFAPFCSDRCKKVDLGRWLGEEYRISRSPSPEDEASLPVVETTDEEPTI